MSNKTIKTTIDCLLDAVSQKQVEEYTLVKDQPEWEQASRMMFSGRVHMVHRRLFHDIETKTKGMCRFEGAHDAGRLSTLFVATSFFESHLTQLFTKFEGNYCCVDKARCVLSKVARFYFDGTRINFNNNQEFTFHVPDKILKDHDEVIEYIESLHNLYYGKPDKFLTLMGVMQ